MTTWNRAEHGDAVLLISNDGRVFRVLDAYRAGLELDDLSGQSMRELLAFIRQQGFGEGEVRQLLRELPRPAEPAPYQARVEAS